MWCFFEGDVFDGVELRNWAQVCFESTLDAPLELTKLSWVTAATVGDLSVDPPLVIEVYTRTDEGPPGELVSSIEIDAVSYGQPGAHEYTFASPIALPAASFCAGLAGGSKQGGSAHGVAVDEEAIEAGVSFYLMNGNGTCLVEEWLDPFIAEPNPTGHFCIGATVREQQ